MDLSSLLGSRSDDKDVDGWIDRADHPLLNDVVLKILFGLMNPMDLKVCRLVCKRWTVLSLSFARTVFVSTVADNNTTYPDKDIREFVQLFGSNTLGIPITKFNVGSFDPTIGIGQTFLQHYGKTTTKMDLMETYEFRNVEHVGALLRSALNLESFKMPSLFRSASPDPVVVSLFPGPETPPELKCLKTLDIGLEYAVNQRRVCPTLYEELLSAAPNITALFTNDLYLTEQEFQSLEVLNILENLGRQSTLEILSLCRVKSDHLEVLKKMIVKPKGLKLKHFLVNWNACLTEVDDSCFLELIPLLKDSLISLHLSLVIVPTSPRRCSINRFPRMSKLKLLDLTFSQVVYWEDFAITFPVLQHLSLSSRRDGELLIGSISCPAIQSLTIRNFTLRSRSLQRILKGCPTLSELEIIDNQSDVENILGMIWTQIPQLEKLKVCCNLPTRNLDSTLTGILTEGVEAELISKLGRLKNKIPEDRRKKIFKMISKYATLPSIRNLTGLRHLTLCVKVNQGEQTVLSDVTGYLGLYSLRNLQSLNISPCQFSKYCSTILVEDLGLHSWNIKDERKRDIIAPKWSPDDDDEKRDFPSTRFTFNYAL